jgi:hypothetical protein
LESGQEGEQIADPMPPNPAFEIPMNKTAKADKNREVKGMPSRTCTALV